ncbi:unnamed protein product [Lampetra planeri]
MEVCNYYVQKACDYDITKNKPESWPIDGLIDLDQNARPVRHGAHCPCRFCSLGASAWKRSDEAEQLAAEMRVPFPSSSMDDVLLHQPGDLVYIVTIIPSVLTRHIAVKTMG